MECFAQVFAVQVGVDLGRGDTLVTEHLLHGAEIGAAFDQVGRERMPEGMGRDTFGNPRLPDKVFQQEEDHHPGEPATPAVEEKDVFVTGFRRHMHPDLVLVDADVFDGGIADRYEAFFIAFADDPDIAFAEIETGDADTNRLADPQTAAVHGFQDGFIAAAFGFAEIDSADDGFNLIKAEYIRECTFEPGRLEQGGRVGLDDL